MAKLSKEELEHIIREEMPAFRLADAPSPQPDSPGRAQLRSPGLRAIQEKLQRIVQPYQPPGQTRGTTRGREDTLQAVQVVPRKSTSLRGSKTVLISSAEKTIIGQQG